MSYDEEQSLRLLQQRLRDQEFENDRSLSQLRSQINILRRQIDTVQTDHQLELHLLAEEHQRLQNRAAKEDVEELQELEGRVENLRSSEQRRKTEREIFERQCAALSDENAVLRNKARDLSQELSYLKHEVLDKTVCQIEDLERQKRTASETHQQEIAQIKDRHKIFIDDLQTQATTKENEIRNLRKNLSFANAQLAEKNQEAKREMIDLEKTLHANRNTLEDFQKEHEKLRQSRDIAKQQTQAMMTENTVMQIDIKKIRRENDELAESIKRLSKIVYGRNNN